MSTHQDTVALLGRVPTFAAFGPEDLQRIAEVAVPRKLRSGEAVFREGDRSNTCYVVRRGHAQAIREHSDGRTITLAQFGPGDIFGELAMFDDETRSATVEAVSDVELVALLAADVRRFLREQPDLALKLLAGVVRRLRGANERVARQSFQTVQSRVATVLAQLAQRAASERDGTGSDGAAAPSGDVTVVATQAEIAQLAGSSRESASRFLATLERAGVITQGRGRITVHETSALDGYVY